MNETLEVDGLIFRVARSSRRKTIGITVRRDASLVAHLPENAVTADAAGLIRSKLVWIYEKLAGHRDEVRGDIFRRPEFVDGESFYLLGRHYRLRLVDPASGEKSIPAIRFVGENLLFPLTSGSSGEEGSGILHARRSTVLERDGSKMEVHCRRVAIEIRERGRLGLPMGLMQRRRHGELPLASDAATTEDH